MVVLFTLGNGLYAQQVLPDSIRMIGEWKLIKVESQLLTQKDDRLLEENTIIITDDQPRIKGFAPLGFSISGQRCRISSVRGIDEGKYLLDVNNTFSYEGDEIEDHLWHIDLQYRFLSDEEMTFIMPAAQFKDNKRNLPVKQINKCHYRKVS